MANHPSAKKRRRQDVKKQAGNTVRRSRVHTAERRLIETSKKKDAAAIKNQLAITVAEIMRARSKGVFHPNTAARKIARLSRAAHRAMSG